MPYIEGKLRKLYDPHINNILTIFGTANKDALAGDFTYIVYRLLRHFSGKFWMRALGIGCLVCAILEIYRKDHAVYENRKEEENGPI